MADYDPDVRYKRRQAIELTQSAEEAIRILPTVPLDDRRILAVRLIIKQR